MKAKSANLRLTFDESGKPELILSLDLSRQEAMSGVQGLREILAKEKLLEVEIKQHRNTRSLNANAYFHLLVGKIAVAMNLGEEETKVRLVLEYGSVMRDENGEKVGFKLPVSVDVNQIYKYAKWFDERMENGRKFNCYIIYGHTHNLDTKQMARLIDGTVYEAQELGLETMTPAELSALKQEWGKA
jgi:hypothetical protein